MSRRRTIILFCAIAMVVLLVALLSRRAIHPVKVLSHGRVTYDDGSPGYMLYITNLTGRTFDVELWRDRLTNAPNASTSYVYRIQTTLQPNTWSIHVLYPPPRNVRWSVELRCLRHPGTVETKLRSLGRRLRLCSESPGWQHLHTIEIEK